jgi:hypothetical protein
MPKRKKNNSNYVAMGFSIKKEIYDELLAESTKFSDLVSIDITPQRFLMKLFRDHMKRNS